MVIASVSPPAEAATAAAMMSAWIVRLCIARVDDVGAELVEQQEPDHQHDQAAQIEDDDAAGQRRREPGREERQATRPRKAHPTPARSADGDV